MALLLLILQIYAFVTIWTTAAHAAKARVLIYTATEKFRHDSIPTAVGVLKAKGSSIDVEFENTEDQSQFTNEVLANYDALVFLSTTGEILRSDEAFQRYINAGGNFVGIHSASDTLRNSTSYINQLGSRFDYHADLQPFTVNVEDFSHPSTSMLPFVWSIRDEAYNFEIDPRSLGAKILLTANESSYVDNGVKKFNQGTPHPLAWYQEKGAGARAGGVAGRSFYTSLGHLNETWQDDLFLSHVLGGISWVLQGNTTRAYNSTALVGHSQASPGSGQPPDILPSVSQTPPSTSFAGRNVVFPGALGLSIIWQCIASFPDGSIV